MSKLHYMTPEGPVSVPMTVRLGAGTGASNNLSIADEGKLVKFVGESRYDLCAAGDLIYAQIMGIEIATSGGYTVGGVNDEDMIWALADGLQATAGTGTIAVGDYVVAGTITAKGTKLTSYPKVCKATAQIGGVPADLTAAGVQVLASLHAWQVVSQGPAGTGAVGTAIVIKPV